VVWGCELEGGWVEALWDCTDANAPRGNGLMLLVVWTGHAED
jgi:hypothetical protein